MRIAAWVVARQRSSGALAIHTRKGWENAGPKVLEYISSHHTRYYAEEALQRLKRKENAQK